MSENGPYNQPPQNPYGGGDNSGGQPPFGQPYGDPNTGGQPGYGAPNTGGQPGYGAPNTGGQPGYGAPNTGGQPGYGAPAGFPGSPEQQMYAGGQPPYPGGPVGPGGPMGPGGPGYPPQPPQPSGGGKAGLWVVIGGGAVIIVLVIAVVVMLVTNGGGNDQVAPEPDPGPSQSAEETTAGGGEGGDEPEPEPGAGAAPAGEPPYAVPAEPCDAFTDQVISDFLIQDGGNKSVRDENSYCDTLEASLPEGNPAEGYAAFEIVYETPYSASDSVEAAENDYKANVQESTGEDPYIDYYKAEDVEESKDVDLGDEAHYVLTKYDFLGDKVPQAVLMIRTANLNVRIEYQLHPPFGEEDSSEDLVMPDNVEEIMLNAGADALAVVGT
ncbi:DUF3558 domain-containing protein [Nocardiopsis quinghaiensis]|uniref:DUF3558 domain-containing protein n=1 Tax=Nocardiopsis quinghaiensis TaxID=464995 RepID=UPI00123848A0|nr:DUF3558 domain-containing protein [Nocardiopsis quinghaiensis]